MIICKRNDKIISCTKHFIETTLQNVSKNNIASEFYCLFI